MAHGRFALRGLAALLGAASLAGCATGQGSFVAGSGGGDGDVAFEEGQSFDDAAPGLVVASGNALLPGGRTLGGAISAPATSASTGGVSLTAGVAGVNANASVNLLNGPATALNLATPVANLNVNTAVGGPLLALNGSRSALLGLSLGGAGVLGVSPSLSAGLGSAVNPATAATQTLVSASVGAVTPAGPVTVPPVGGGPLLPPALGVPGVTPLQTLLPMLPTTKTPLAPGLLGN